MKLAISIVVSAMLALSGPVCAAEPDGVVIGLSVAASGPNSRLGQDPLRGLQLWAEEVNGRGGLLGHKVTIAHSDDAGDAAAIAPRYEKLLVDDNASVLIGPYAAEAAATVAAVAEKYGAPVIVPGAATKEAWRRDRKNVFALYAPPDAYLDHILAFARSKGLRRVALVYQNAALTREIAEGIKAKVGDFGMHLVFEQEYEKESTDFLGMLGKLKLKRPDIFIMASYSSDAVAFMRQAKENKFAARIMAFAPGASSSEFGGALGADAEGVLGIAQWEPALKTTVTAEFMRKYKLKYGQAAAYQAADGYAIGQLIEAATKKAGSFEREHLRKALSELDTVTVLGRYKVDASGWQIGRAGYAVQWLHGERVPVLPADTATETVKYPFQAWGRR